MATMTIIKCDKCHKQSSFTDQFKHIRAYNLYGADIIGNATKQMDVCEECYKKIFQEEEDNG